MCVWLRAILVVPLAAPAMSGSFQYKIGGSRSYGADVRPSASGGCAVDGAHALRLNLVGLFEQCSPWLARCLTALSVVAPGSPGILVNQCQVNVASMFLDRRALATHDIERFCEFNRSVAIRIRSHDLSLTRSLSLTIYFSSTVFWFIRAVGGLACVCTSMEWAKCCAW